MNTNLHHELNMKSKYMSQSLCTVDFLSSSFFKVNNLMSLDGNKKLLELVEP